MAWTAISTTPRCGRTIPTPQPCKPSSPTSKLSYAPCPALTHCTYPEAIPATHHQRSLLPAAYAREVEVLHRYHPNATVWVSAQGFDRVHYERFYTLLDARPAWLTGVFFGPQSRDSFFTQRKRVPARYAMQFYLDIAHRPMQCLEFPVPQWDPIFALTEGREPICPRPAALAIRN